ncbi:MAG: universal stress protein, partial [Staphylothermus sp.]|nr:universal stress protein [Staphylothermus sp.]
PDSVYHILSVIPQLSKKRSLYTKLIDQSFEKIAREAIEEIEYLLHRKGVHYIKKTILRGDPVKKIKKYVEIYNIDLIVLSSSSSPTPPSRLIGSTASKIVSVIPRPILVITPYSFERKEDLLKNGINKIGLVCLNINNMQRAIELAYYLCNKHNALLDIILSKKTNRDKLIELQNKLGNMGLKINTIVIDHTSIEEFVKKSLEELDDANAIITTRQKTVTEKIPFPFLHHRVTKYERLFMGLSAIPIFIV